MLNAIVNYLYAYILLGAAYVFLMSALFPEMSGNDRLKIMTLWPIQITCNRFDALCLTPEYMVDFDKLKELQ